MWRDVWWATLGEIMRIIILAMGLLSATSSNAADCSLLTSKEMYAAIVHQSRDQAGAEHTCMCPGDRVDGKRCTTRTTKDVMSPLMML
jgi:hypothetical protein